VTRTPSYLIRAFLPAPLVIGGVVLQPPTIGHCLILDRIGSKTLSGDGMDAADVMTCLCVLASPYSSSRQTLDFSREVFDAAVVEFSKTIAPLDAVELHLLLRAHLAGAFQSFIKTEFKKAEGEGEVQYGADGDGVGWLGSLITALLNQAHWPMEEILNTPIATAFALTTINRIHNGAEWADFSYVAIDRIDAEDSAAALGAGLVERHEKDEAAKKKTTDRKVAKPKDPRNKRAKSDREKPKPE
jgi:hypothetical protein